jgi:hypothetical protein
MKTFLLSLILLLTSFSFSQTQQEIEGYFNEVAYGSDAMIGSQTQIITKWEKNCGHDSCSFVWNASQNERIIVDF